MNHKFILEEAQEEVYRIAGKQVTIRRDDKAFLPPLPPNAKMSALYAIVARAAKQGYRRVVMFAKKQQGISYATGLPVFCEEFNMECTITYPASNTQPIPKWLDDLQMEYTFCYPARLHPNMVTINVNQSKKIAEEQGAYFVPFGFDDVLSVNAHALKFHLPQEVGTLLMSTMTGMILAGTLWQIRRRAYKVKKVIAISGGRPPDNVHKSVQKYMDDLDDFTKYCPLEIINPFDRNIDALGGVKLWNAVKGRNDLPDYFHPDYEAKAWLWLLQNIEHLQEPIYFINVGR